jgi:3-phosphoshikimate 1-carboxyvinyltransferase
MQDMKTITPKEIKEQSLIIPGSKSITHRMLICAALCQGVSNIHNVLESEDTKYTMSALSCMGAGISPIVGVESISTPGISPIKNGICQIKGFGDRPQPYAQDIYLGNSGTSMRLLAGVAALGARQYCLTGDSRMCLRPMKALIDALKLLGIHAEGCDKKGNPPVCICGGSRQGGPISLDCSTSSQYLSSLLMIGPFMENGLEIQLQGPPVSSPYIDLTLDVMKKFKVEAHRIKADYYKVSPNQKYNPGTFRVEPDLSNAGYFWAIGAVTGKMIYVRNISPNSLQGDLKQMHILEKMGCTISIKDNEIGVCGRDLIGIDIDMSDTPDAVPAIAIVACFARGRTRILNIKHLREKESDRINAIATQVKKMGINVKQGDDFLEIKGGRSTRTGLKGVRPKGAMIETFNDHRIAMAFSIPGLIIPGVGIQNPACVQKSFPNYWKIFDEL